MQSLHWLFCWFHKLCWWTCACRFALLMMHQQKCQWSLCIANDISTQDKKPLCISNDISTNVSPNYRVLAFVLLSHQTCKVAHCCWCFINSAKCSFTLLLIYQHKCKVAFALLMIYQQKCQWALCMFNNIACEHNKTVSSNSTQFALCYSQIQCFTTMSFVLVLHFLWQHVLLAKPLSAIVVWRLNAHMRTHA